MTSMRSLSARASLGAVLVAACAPAGGPGAGRPPPSPPGPAAITVESVVPDAGSPADAGAGPGTSLLGTAHPITLEAADPAGRWVVVCQARDDTDGSGAVGVSISAHGRLVGDAMVPYLIDSRGTESRLDAFVAASPSGDHVSFLRAGRLVLRDVAGGTEVDLTGRGADSRDDRAPFAGHRALVFDATGRRVAYFARRGARTIVVVRSLGDGEERELDPGPADPWRASFAGEAWLVVRVVGDDTNGNGRLDWPVPPASRARGCAGPRPPFAAWLEHGDRDATYAFRATGGSPVVRAGFVSPLGGGLLLREPSGRLVLDVTGGIRELLPASCGGKLLHVDVDRSTALATCGDPAKAPAALTLIGPWGRADLGYSVASPSGDALGRSAERLVPVHPGAETVLVDIDSRRAFPLRRGDTVLATRGDVALVRRGDALVLASAAGAVRELARGLDARGGFVAGRRAAYAAPFSVRFDGAVVRLDAEPRGVLAVADDGRALVASTPFDADRLALGPLRWLRAGGTAP